MENPGNICQSCGMPLDKDPHKGGTNADQSISTQFCSFCFCNGRFYDEGITLQEKIEKNIAIAVKGLGISEETARENAQTLLPTLERWKS